MVIVKAPRYDNSSLCNKCKGRHWNPNSQKNTQMSAKAEFGIIPNKCVTSSDGHIQCPYARKK